MAVPSRIVLAVAATVATLAIGACMTTSGGAFRQVVGAETAEQPAPPPPAPPEAGLQIVTEPDHVEVILDNTYVGVSPVTITDIPAGPHQLRLARAGYYDMVVWIDFPGGSMRYQAALTPITGYVQVRVYPSNAEVRIGARAATGDSVIELPVGSYDVQVRAFGYQDYQSRLYITGPGVVPLQVTLQPAPFDLTGLSIRRASVNPGDPGLLGTVEATFTVTAPGSGTAVVLDERGAEVRRDTLPPFGTWNQQWRWRPPDSVPDGDYRLTLTAEGGGGPAISQEASFRIDRSVSVSPRSSWSGSAGLLYAPGVDTLPGGAFQVSLLADPAFDTTSFYAPIALSLRAGLASRTEVDLVVGAIPASFGTPIFGSAAFRWEVVPASHPFGVGLGLDAKLSFAGVPGIGVFAKDTFANFSGASIGVPVQVTLGPISLVSELAVIGSLWRPDYGIGVFEATAEPGAWLYARAGVMADLGPLVAGVSLSVRSQPLPAGLLSGAPPLELGAEVHYLVPATHLVISAIGTGEVQSAADWYFSGGGGIGLIY